MIVFPLIFYDDAYKKTHLGIGVDLSYFIGLDIFNYIGNFAFKNKAQFVKRFRRDRATVLHSVKRIGGYTVLENQSVFRNALAV